MDNFVGETNANYVHSTLRERIVEHVFVGEVLRRLWQLGVTDVEVLRSEFDAGGYDLVMSYHKVVRHIQLKKVSVDGKADSIKISLKLGEKPSGCVIWIVVTPELELQSYLWFGGSPGEQLSDISNMPVAKHTKGNAKGTKAERPNHRVLSRGKFDRLDTLDAVLARLFGPLS
jgi:hypothetical protein